MKSLLFGMALLFFVLSLISIIVSFFILRIRKRTKRYLPVKNYHGKRFSFIKDQIDFFLENGTATQEEIDECLVLRKFLFVGRTMFFFLFILAILSVILIYVVKI